MSFAIRVDNLGKSYRLGATHAGSIREVVNRTWKRLLGRKDTLLPHEHATLQALAGSKVDEDGSFWALRDVSFEVQPGEVVGIIGRNGSGKSTLLKILSQITAPTTGRVELHGRVASLLEVGTGFHPELSGRENVFLNGAILGMTKPEIRRKFDEIVAFAEIEPFIDTPVKRYSSGMYVRLAFAVAAHLQTEILIVDEVLAVGDATYQQKCIQRMNQLGTSGITVLFVSHNMEVVPKLCGRAAYLENGELTLLGDVSTVVRHYVDNQALCAGGAGDLRRLSRIGDGKAKFIRYWLLGPDGSPTYSHVSGADFDVFVQIESKHELRDIAISIILYTMSGVRLITSWTREQQFHCDLQPGLQTFRCTFRQLMLRPGHRIKLQFWMASSDVIDSIEDVGPINILNSESMVDYSTNASQGIVLCPYNWTQILDPTTYGFLREE